MAKIKLPEPRKRLLFLVLFTLHAGIYSNNPIGSSTKNFDCKFNEGKIELHGILPGKAELQILRQKLKDGLKYHIEYEFRVYRKPEKWYQFRKLILEQTRKLAIEYNDWNQVYVIITENRKLPYIDFESAWKKILQFSYEFSMPQVQPGTYFCEFRGRGYSLSLQFPLSSIYRSLISRIDFLGEWQRSHFNIP